MRRVLSRMTPRAVGPFHEDGNADRKHWQQKRVEESPFLGGSVLRFSLPFAYLPLSREKADVWK